MLDISKIDPYVLTILKDCGWSLEREYDISSCLELLSQEGYACFDYAEKILRNLGGIAINVVGDKSHMSATFDFNPLDAASGEFDRLYDFQVAANEELYPIGNMVQAIVYVGKSKKIYWGDWRNFYWSGDSIEDYLNNIFDLNFKPKEIDFNI